VDIYGTQTETGLGEGNVTVEIFDANGNLLGVSEPATIIADSWLNVLLPNLAFDGIFYAMVHYNMVDANMVGADIDGTNLSSGYYYDAEFGFVALETWDMACALGIRVNANIQGTAKTVFSQIQNNVANEIPENLNFAKNFGSKTANYIAAKSSDLTFNIYLNDLITPIATNLTSYEYLITSEFLTENGTYTVGVASAYTSGISEIITTDFVYGGVGINNLQNNSVVKIYPVPVNNILNISNANNSKGFIYNNIGQLVQTIEINSENSTFDVSNLQSGSYVLIFLRLSINR